LPDHEGNEIKVSCRCNGPCAARGEIEEELIFLHNRGSLDDTERVTITFWDDLEDKYGNKSNHVDIFAISWSCGELRRVNWQGVEQFVAHVDFPRMANVRMAYNNVGAKDLADDCLGGTPIEPTNEPKVGAALSGRYPRMEAGTTGAAGKTPDVQVYIAPTAEGVFHSTGLSQETVAAAIKDGVKRRRIFCVAENAVLPDSDDWVSVRFKKAAETGPLIIEMAVLNGSSANYQRIRWKERVATTVTLQTPGSEILKTLDGMLSHLATSYATPAYRQGQMRNGETLF